MIIKGNSDFLNHRCLNQTNRNALIIVAAGGALTKLQATIITMNAYAIVGPTPCEQACLSISKQNVIAICTPKIIHLWKLDFLSNGNPHITRTYVPLEELNYIQDAARQSQQDWIGCLHGGEEFRTICWIRDLENPSMDQLVVLTTNGSIVLLKNTPRIGFLKGWKFATINMPEGRFTSIACRENFVFSSQTTGTMYRWDNDKQKTMSSISLKRTVSCIFPTSTSIVFAVTLDGLIYRCDFSQSDATLVCDDGILQPGPSAILEHQNQKLILLSKFNRLYFIEDGSSPKLKIIMVPSDCPITGFEIVKEGKILIGMMDNSWHLFNWISMTFGAIPKTFTKLEEPPSELGINNDKSSQEFEEDGGEQVADENSIQDSAMYRFYLAGSQVELTNSTSKFQIITHYDPSEEHPSAHLWAEFSEIQPDSQKMALNSHTSCRICGSALEKGRLWTCQQGHFFEV